MDKELMKLNIQLFADEADNADDVENDEANYEEADDVVDETLADAEDADGEEDEKEVDESSKTKSSTKEYSERLNKERERIRKEIEDAQNNKLNAIAKNRGFNSWEELEKFDEEQRLESFGITDTDEFTKYLNDIIEKNPKILEANAIIMAQEEIKKNEFLKGQIAEISRINPNIKTLDDLASVDKYEELVEKIEKGYNMLDAYKLVYFEEIKNNTFEAAKKQATVNLTSKSHLKTSSGASTKEVRVPSEIMAMYKKNMPNISEAEIRAHYAKSMK